jgi:regulator of RNase E activity RraA
MDEQLRNRYFAASTASVASALLKRGLRNVWIRGAMPIVGGVTPLTVGPAFTLRFIPMREDFKSGVVDPASTSRAAVEAMPPGCVVVADAGGVAEAGLVGDVLCARMNRRGVQAFICDAAVRDHRGLATAGLAVWARGVASPAPGNAFTFADWGLPIGCGGVAVVPNDLIVADRDGVVVVPLAIADEVAAEAEEIEHFDAWAIAEVQQGASLPGLYPPSEQTLSRFREATKCT